MFIANAKNIENFGAVMNTTKSNFIKLSASSINSPAELKFIRGSMKISFILMACLSILFANVLSVKAKPPVKKTPAAKAKAKPKPAKVDSQVTYANNVKAIGIPLNTLVAKISTDVFVWDLKRKTIEERKALGMDVNDEEFQREKLGADYVPITEEVKTLKNSILKNIPFTEMLLKQIRSIKTVPKSLKSVDENLVKFSKAGEIAVKNLKYSLDNDNRTSVTIANKDMSKAFEFYNKAIEELDRKTDPSAKAKKYVDG